MRIEHIGIWTSNLEEMKDFYVKYFKAVANLKYENIKKEFQSYFLTFEDGARLELMSTTNLVDRENSMNKLSGLNHFAIKVDTVFAVMKVTETLRKNGYAVVGEPRTTGDGYVESIVLDPDGNRLEITK